jgi:hypothetical protein
MLLVKVMVLPLSRYGTTRKYMKSGKPSISRSADKTDSSSQRIAANSLSIDLFVFLLHAVIVIIYAPSFFSMKNGPFFAATGA